MQAYIAGAHRACALLGGRVSCHPRRGAESRLAARARQLPTPAAPAEDDPDAIRGCPREPQGARGPGQLRCAQKRQSISDDLYDSKRAHGTVDQGRGTFPQLRERRGHASRFYLHQGVWGGAVAGAENATVLGLWAQSAAERKQMLQSVVVLF